MKKKLLILTALLTFAISAMTVSAKALGKTNVTYQVDPSYEVVIPSDATVPFLTEKSAYGTIEIYEGGRKNGSDHFDQKGRLGQGKRRKL